MPMNQDDLFTFALGSALGAMIPLLRTANPRGGAPYETAAREAWAYAMAVCEQAESCGAFDPDPRVLLSLQERLDLVDALNAVMDEDSPEPELVALRDRLAPGGEDDTRVRLSRSTTDAAADMLEALHDNRDVDGQRLGELVYRLREARP